MRIAYVITRGDAVGGATVHVTEMAAAMLARGHEVAVFIGGSGAAAARIASAGIPVRGLRFLRRAVRPDRDVRALLEITTALREFRPDLVSTHTAKAGWVGRAACARLGIPVIHTPHGLPMGDRMAGLRGAFFQTAERLAGGWARAVICVCEYERRLAVARRIAPPERLLVVPNGVRDIPDSLIAKPEANPVRIVSVARFEHPKDHATLLEAFARLRSLEWELELIGDGPLEPAARELAERLGIGARVRFAGYQADVAGVLAQARIFVLSSRSEALPRSVLEAMRAGLPVVATDVGGVSELVDNGRNGLLVPRRDAAALAAAVENVISNPGFRKLLGTAGRRMYESRFRVEQMIEKTTAIYRMALRP